MKISKKGIIILIGLSGVLVTSCRHNWLTPQRDIAQLQSDLRLTLDKAEAARHLNIFTWLDEADIMAQSERLQTRMENAAADSFPLWGVKYVAKANIDTDFMPTSGGTPALQGLTPPQSAPVIDRLQAAGAILIGKTNMHELAFGITSNNKTFGPVRNPYHHAYIAGGSSGGTAAAIAAGIVDVGLGSDTGGSVRIPAALSGIFGFRPTIGRYDASGTIPLSQTRDTIGVLANRMGILIDFDAVITGQTDEPEIDLRQLRIGVPKAYFHEDLHPDVAAQLEQMQKRITARSGVTFVPADIENIGTLNEAVGFPIVLYEFPRDLRHYLDMRGQVDFDTVLSKIASDNVRGALASAAGEGAVPEDVYQAALNVHRPKLQAAYRDYFQTHKLDAMLVMTTPLPASKLGEEETILLNGKKQSTFFTYIRNTDPVSNAGMAAVSIPVGLSEEGLPIGAELVGLQNSDRRLLQIANAFSRILHRLPPPPRVHT